MFTPHVFKKIIDLSISSHSNASVLSVCMFVLFVFLKVWSTQVIISYKTIKCPILVVLKAQT